MPLDSELYAPFFREGMLYLPAKTIDLLIRDGLDLKKAEDARQGLRLDDDRQLIAEISNQLERILESMSEESTAFQELNTEDTRFMLSDIDDKT